MTPIKKKEEYIASLMKPKTFKPPKSNLLSKLEKFLPQLKQANEQLVVGEDVDIENVQEGKEYIEMNLDLGVFDVQLKDDVKNSTADSNSEFDIVAKERPLKIVFKEENSLDSVEASIVSSGVNEVEDSIDGNDGKGAILIEEIKEQE